MYFNRKELEKFKNYKGPLIDVRSPIEYYKGHMTNSINIPLFDNDERAIIGTTYKKRGKEKAVIEGLKIVDRKIEILLNKIFRYIEIYKTNNNIKDKEQLIRIYCSRGGMRSASISWLLDKYEFNSVTLKGGYKNYRKWIIDSFSRKLNIIVIGGKTGTGKTILLNILERNGFQTIDLEGFANHRGSTFGGLGMNEQPTNEQFENVISEKLNTFDINKNVFVEAESANIGKCKIPYEFFKQMKEARRIEIIRSETNRINELVNTYSVFSEEDLQESVLRIKKRLGPQRTKMALQAIKDRKWDLVCKAVLDYYDKCYEYEKIGKKCIDSLDLTDIEYDDNVVRLINKIL